MDEFTKKRIFNLESALETKKLECELLTSKNLLLEKQVEATKVGVQVLKKHLCVLQDGVKTIIHKTLIKENLKK